MSNKIKAKDYIVLDVETNGLSSINDDLLSISIYKPDDKKIYNRFLPLELSDYVETTHINGITTKMLKDKLPLTQKEFDKLIVDFELDKRVILIYGNIDEKFIKNYLKRKNIKGFEKLTFYNFKHDIISSRFSEGNITKDNLCRIYNIENVQDVHSGINDCILEWQLFEFEEPIKHTKKEDYIEQWKNNNSLDITRYNEIKLDFIAAMLLKHPEDYKYQVKREEFIANTMYECEYEELSLEQLEDISNLLFI